MTLSNAIKAPSPKKAGPTRGDLMWTRRRFLSRSGLALLGPAGACLAVPGDGPADNRDALPDGSAAKGMITQETDQAIERGLAFLNGRRHRDGSFGTNAYTGNVAV